jgi:hypothetical protein
LARQAEVPFVVEHSLARGFVTCVAVVVEIRGALSKMAEHHVETNWPMAFGTLNRINGSMRSRHRWGCMESIRCGWGRPSKGASCS